MCIMALILSGLATIPFTDSKQPKILPFCLPNTHISGLSFNCALHILVKVSRSSIFVVFFLLAITMSST
jgi:hypothetical protein